MTPTDRPLFEIAREIKHTWPKMNYAAVPYYEAMLYLNTMNDSYGMDSARSIVLYFLSNASGWRGDIAKRIKAELRGMLNA